MCLPEARVVVVEDRAAADEAVAADLPQRRVAGCGHERAQNTDAVNDRPRRLDELLEVPRAVLERDDRIDLDEP